MHYLYEAKGLPRWPSGKVSACQCSRQWFSPWVEKIPWRRKWQPTPVFLPGKFHGQRSLTGYIVHGIAKHQTWLKAHTYVYIYLLLILLVVWQKPAQHCKLNRFFFNLKSNKYDLTGNLRQGTYWMERLSRKLSGMYLGGKEQMGFILIYSSYLMT